MMDQPNGDELEDNPDLDAEETEEQATDPPERSSLFRMMVWINVHMMTIVGGTLVLGTVATWVLGIEIPRPAKLSALSFGGALFVIGRPTAGKAKDLLWDPLVVWMVDVEADGDDAGIYNEPMPKFQDWDVEDKGDWRAPNLVFFEDVDYENKRAVGTWTGTKSGRELMSGLSIVKEVRGQLDQDAREGWAIQEQAWIVVQRATRSAVETINETFKRGALPDEGEPINQAVDQAMADFGVKRSEIEDLDDDAPADEVPGIELRVPDVEEVATAGRETGQDGQSGGSDD